MRVLAELFEGVESQTPYGGRAVSWNPLGSAWRRRPSEAVTAETRADPRLVAGRVLRFGGSDWRIRSGETVGGRAILNLERTP